MIEALAAGFVVGFAVSAPWAAALWGMRRQRDLYRSSFNFEADRGEQLTKLLMAREAPQEFAAYIEPHSLAEEFPADAVWSDDGLFYMVPGE